MPKTKNNLKHKLNPCNICGSSASEKNVNMPFPHGWVGCRYCDNKIYWTGGGKMDAIRQWNEKSEKR